MGHSVYQDRLNQIWWLSWPALLFYVGSLLCLLFYLYRFLLNRRLQLAESKRLMELDAYKVRLYANITHEFRTPLTIILGMARQIREDPKRWYTEGLTMITSNGLRLLHLVNQMLDLTKLEKRKLKLQLHYGNIVVFLRYLVQSFESVAAAKNIQLHFLTEAKEIEMDFDPEQLTKVVGNLLSNAVKYTPENGQVYLTVCLRGTETSQVSETWKVSKALELRVKDNGTGIPPEEIPHIFDRFYQVENATTRMVEGTGLGLNLTRELVQLMGGAIEVESRVGEGSDFIVRLPVSRSAPKLTDSEGSDLRRRTETAVFDMGTHGIISPNMESSQAITKTIPQNGDLPTILLIEDNRDVLKYLASCLEGRYELEFALNGREGIEQALETVPDIIISDVMMPEKDGYEVCAALKKDVRTSHIPIILLTAKADRDSRKQGLQSGADAYLAKPFNKEELEIRLDNLLQLRRQLQAHYSQPGPVRNKAAHKREDLFLKKLKDEILANLNNEGFGIAQLCREIRLSRSQLHKKLKALTGNRLQSSYVLYAWKWPKSYCGIPI